MITETQRQQRKDFIGSSDASAIVGVNPWKSAVDIYWDKIPNAKVEQKKEEENNDVKKIGKFLESSVLDWFEHDQGKIINRDQRLVHANGIMAANYDAIVAGDQTEAVEAKTAGVLYQFDRDEWGEEQTDEVPEHIIIQCQHQMAVLPTIQVVWVPVLLAGLGFRLYKVERSNELIEHLETQELNFWNQHVKALVPPTDNLPTIDTIKSLYRVPNKVVPIQDELVKAWMDAKAAKSAAEKAEDLAKRGVLAVLGDAEAGDCSLGRVTYFSQKRESYYVEANEFRVARFKKNKK